MQLNITELKYIVHCAVNGDTEGVTQFFQEYEERLWNKRNTLCSRHHIRTANKKINEIIMTKKGI